MTFPRVLLGAPVLSALELIVVVCEIGQQMRAEWTDAVLQIL